VHVVTLERVGCGIQFCQKMDWNRGSGEEYGGDLAGIQTVP